MKRDGEQGRGVVCLLPGHLEEEEEEEEVGSGARMNLRETWRVS